MRAAKRARRPAPRTEALNVPPTFLEFCEWFGVTLTDGQAEYARVAYDLAEPSGGLGQRLFGFAGPVPMGARGVVAAVCGARGGKSYIAVALRLVWGMLVRDLSSLAPGQRAVALIIAPNDKLRREVLNYARGAVRSKPEVEAMVAEDSAEGFGLRRTSGHIVRFETGVATAGGYGARGRALTDFALDECAFFRDSSFKVNDEEIFRAGSARVLPGGQVIIASTPWAQAGLLYDLHKRNFGKPESALVAHAPTLVLHDSPMTRSIVEREELRDPDNAKREFGAQFMTGGTTVFFEAASLGSAFVDEPFEPEPGDAIVAGSDLGFRSDSSALIFAALRGDVAHVYTGVELRPGEDEPLDLDATFATFAKEMKGRCKLVMADQFGQLGMSQALARHGLDVVPADKTPADRYVRARNVLRAKRVKIHPLPFRDRLERQLREVQGKPTSGGGMSILHPRWATGGHGDIADALVLALWQLYGEEVPANLTPLEDRAAQLKRERYEHFKSEEERPHWVSKGGAADRGRGAHWRRR